MVERFVIPVMLALNLAYSTVLFVLLATGTLGIGGPLAGVLGSLLVLWFGMALALCCVGTADWLNRRKR